MRRAEQIGGHVEIDGRHEIARPECHPVERGAVTARDRGIRRRVEDLLRHVLVLEHVDEILPPRQARLPRRPSVLRT